MKSSRYYLFKEYAFVFIAFSFTILQLLIFWPRSSGLNDAFNCPIVNLDFEGERLTFMANCTLHHKASFNSIRSMLFKFYCFFFVVTSSGLLYLISISISERFRYMMLPLYLPAADEATKLKLTSKADKFIIFIYLDYEIKKILKHSFNHKLTEKQLRKIADLFVAAIDESPINQQSFVQKLLQLNSLEDCFCLFCSSDQYY